MTSDDRTGPNFLWTLALSLIACLAAIFCTAVTMLGIVALTNGTEFWRQTSSILTSFVFLGFLWTFLRLLGR